MAGWSLSHGNAASDGTGKREDEQDALSNYIPSILITLLIRRPYHCDVRLQKLLRNNILPRRLLENDEFDHSIIIPLSLN